jgi:hypothetical protein
VCVRAPCRALDYQRGSGGGGWIIECGKVERKTWSTEDFGEWSEATWDLQLTVEMFGTSGVLGPSKVRRTNVVALDHSTGARSILVACGGGGRIPRSAEWWRRLPGTSQPRLTTGTGRTRGRQHSAQSRE